MAWRLAYLNFSDHCISTDKILNSIGAGFDIFLTYPQHLFFIRLTQTRLDSIIDHIFP